MEPLSQSGGLASRVEVRDRDEGLIGAALPARRAQAQLGVSADLPALGAGPGRVFQRARPGAYAAPAGVFAQVASLTPLVGHSAGMAAGAR